MKKNILARQISLIISALSVAPLSASTWAQDNEEDPNLEEVFVTGTRFTSPGTVSSSPISSVGEAEIDYAQQPEIERILRALPSFTTGDGTDGSNVNNGSSGASTLSLRGLGPERTLVLLNGRRMVPFNYDGEVDPKLQRTTAKLIIYHSPLGPLSAGIEAISQPPSAGWKEKRYY